VQIWPEGVDSDDVINEFRNVNKMDEKALKELISKFQVTFKKKIYWIELAGDIHMYWKQIISSLHHTPTLFTAWMGRITTRHLAKCE
jgi:hypothetical protein